jgi:hypothetical protein
MSRLRFRPGTGAEVASLREFPVFSVDLGFSRAARSTGLAWSMPEGNVLSENLRFGTCLAQLRRLLHRQSKVVLILEAPLSGFFSAEGNPVERGSFEKRLPNTNADRYWYSGPGAATCLASVFFLRELRSSLDKDAEDEVEIILYEGFVTFKTGRTDHGRDARILLLSFLGRQERRVIDLRPEEGQTVVSVMDVVEAGNSGSAAPAVIIPELAQTVDGM